MKILNYNQFHEIILGMKYLENVEQYINEVGLSEWTEKCFNDDVYKYIKCIECIFDLQSKSFKEIRKSTGLSCRKFSLIYDIPMRTIQDWEKDNTEKENDSVKRKNYTRELVLYTIFIEAFYNDTEK